MAEDRKRFVILDPTVEPETTPAKMAVRLDSLDGKVVGLLDNGKMNSDRVLRYIGEYLRSEHGVKEVVYRNKGNPSRVAPEPLVRELAQTCDAVVAGIGD